MRPATPKETKMLGSIQDRIVNKTIVFYIITTHKNTKWCMQFYAEKIESYLILNDIPYTVIEKDPRSIKQNYVRSHLALIKKK